MSADAGAGDADGSAGADEEAADGSAGVDREAAARASEGDEPAEFGPDDGVLVTRDLTKHFGGLTAVDDLSFAVQEREILGFIGPNGAGKSTTFNCITGVYPPSSGTVWFEGREVTGEPFHAMVKQGMARTFQKFRPLEDRTVLKNVQTALVPDRLFSTSGLRGETRARAMELCERVGLGEDMEKTPDELPHAEMIRLEMARAMATDPDLLLVDEPFAGLSGEDIAALSSLMEELRAEGVTLVVVDHNMRGLLQLIDRAIVINFGSLLATGTPEEIRSNSDVRDAYLGSGEV